MPVVGAAAAAQYAQAWKALAQGRIAVAEVKWIPSVEFGRLVELGMTIGRGVGSEAFEPCGPSLSPGQRPLEMGRVSAVHHVP